MVRTVFELKEAELRDLQLKFKLSIGGRKSDKLERLVEALNIKGLDPETDDMDKETEMHSNDTQIDESGATGDTLLRDSTPTLHELMHRVDTNFSDMKQQLTETHAKMDERMEQYINRNNGKIINLRATDLESLDSGICQRIAVIEDQVKILQNGKTPNVNEHLQTAHV